MNLSLSPEVEAIIERRVRSGQFGTAEEVVTAALLNLRDDAASGDFAPGEWDAMMAAAKQSGPPLDGDAVFARLLARESIVETAAVK